MPSHLPLPWWCPRDCKGAPAEWMGSAHLATEAPTKSTVEITPITWIYREKRWGGPLGWYPLYKVYVGLIIKGTTIFTLNLWHCKRCMAFFVVLIFFPGKRNMELRTDQFHISVATGWNKYVAKMFGGNTRERLWPHMFSTSCQEAARSSKNDAGKMILFNGITWHPFGRGNVS